MSLVLLIVKVHWMDISLVSIIHQVCFVEFPEFFYWYIMLITYIFLNITQCIQFELCNQWSQVLNIVLFFCWQRESSNMLIKPRKKVFCFKRFLILIKGCHIWRLIRSTPLIEFILLRYNTWLIKTWSTIHRFMSIQ